MTVEGYREAFSVIPAEYRKSALGREWIPYENRRMVRVTMCMGLCCCPIGVIFTESIHLGPLATMPASWYAHDLIKEHFQQNISAEVLRSFMNDWDKDRLTVEEMEAIFA